MFPNLDNPPASLSQDISGFFISLNVSLNLGPPKAFVDFGTLEVSRATVPEATVYKDSNLRLPENYVCPSIQILFRFSVYAITKPGCVH